jgi:peptidoglycan/xylan/chitin deacetylase (PgdA/CDA1 family)
MLKLICAVLPIATLGCLNPVDTLKTFYQAIASHDCEKAVTYADGYSVERCKNIASLQLGESIRVIEKQKNKQLLQFSVSYKQSKQTNTTTTEATVVLNRNKDDSWKVDFSSLKTLPVPDTDQPVATKPAEPAIKPPESPAPVSSPPPVAAPDKPDGLLALWQTEQLQGKSGDEKIHWLRKPDFSPPARTQPNDTLPPLKPEWMNSIRRVKLPANKKWVALTFDLCERADEVAGYDRGVINALRDKKVKATFYAGGKWMQSHPEQTMQLMADNLFEIGNHGWTHGNLRVLQGERMQQQIVWTQAEYERQWDVLHDKAKTAGLENLMSGVPRQPATLRFPFGTCSPESMQATNALGLGAVQWDVVSGDPAITVQPNIIVSETRPGSIVIFHANGRGHGTAAALPRIVDELRAKGFEFVTVSELLAAGSVEAVDECYELRKGDNIDYDAKYGEGIVQVRRAKAKPKPQPKPQVVTPTPEPSTPIP